jgi:hypothetical protein
VATGSPPPGFVPPKGVAAETADTEKKLLALFDREALRKSLTNAGKPLDSSATGLTLASLASIQDLRPGLRSLLGDFEIAQVANLSPDAFSQEAERRGIDAAAVRSSLDTLHKDAVQVMGLLRSLPVTWSLSPDRT